MIGLFGGTFDPVHYGHLRPALEVSEALGLNEVRFLPCRVPPHRGMPSASAEQRLAMLKVAIADQPGFRVDTRELARAGPSYTVDTLGSLRRELVDVPLCLMLGLDAFLGLCTWHRWWDLPKLAHVVVMQRPGTVFETTGELQTLLAHHETRDVRRLAGEAAGSILFCPVTQLDISATAIRGDLRESRSPRYLLPDAVLAWIRAHRLYR